MHRRLSLGVQVHRAGLEIALRYAPNPRAKTLTLDDLIYDGDKLARAVE